MASAVVSDRARRAFAALIVPLALLAARPARADASAADKATAEALFDHARALMKEGKYAEACPKFLESMRLDAGLGTQLYLADCYEKNGQTASAWAEFVDAASIAKNTGQAERERRARERAAALEPKLNRISITVAVGADVAGLEVKRDHQAVAKAMWGTAVPLDPGDHVIEASAPGKRPWTTTVTVSALDTTTLSVVVPALVDAPPPPEPPKPEAPKAEPPKPEPPKAEAPKIEAPKPQPPKPKPLVVVHETTPPARVMGYTVMALGLAGLGTGGVLGMVVMLKKADSTTNCRIDNVCLSDAAAARSGALDVAKASNIAFIAGGAAFVTGVVVLFATKPTVSVDPIGLRVVPIVGPGVGGVSAGASF